MTYKIGNLIRTDPLMLFGRPLWSQVKTSLNTTLSLPVKIWPDPFKLQADSTRLGNCGHFGAWA